MRSETLGFIGMMVVMLWVMCCPKGLNRKEKYILGG
jgi:hypothetical protein